MALSGDVNDIIPKTELLDLRNTGNATNDFVFDRLFKLNFFKATIHTYSEFGVSYHHTKVKIAGFF